MILKKQKTKKKRRNKMETVKKPKLHYAWIVLLATIVMNFFYSIVFSSFSMYGATILEANPELSRTAYSIVPTLHSAFATVWLLLYGKIAKKVSFRLIMLLGGISIAIGFMI